MESGEWIALQRHLSGLDNQPSAVVSQRNVPVTRTVDYSGATAPVSRVTAVAVLPLWSLSNYSDLARAGGLRIP